MSQVVYVRTDEPTAALTAILQRWPLLNDAADDEVDDLPWAADPLLRPDGQIELAVSYGYVGEFLDELASLPGATGWVVTC